LEVVEVEAVITAGISQPITKSNIEVAKPQTFNGKARKVLEFLMAYKNKNERDNNNKANPMDVIIYPGWISRYLKEKCFKRFGNKNFGIYNSREVFGRF